MPGISCERADAVKSMAEDADDEELIVILTCGGSQLNGHPSLPGIAGARGIRSLLTYLESASLAIRLAPPAKTQP